MREFELCYDLEYRSRELTLIPLRFGFARPRAVPWSDIRGAKCRVIEYRFDITPPAGIMSRFIVKVHPMIVRTREKPKGVYWHNGVFVCSEKQGREWRSEALCEFNAERRTLCFTVKAAYPQNMVGKLDTYAEAVLNFFEGLKPELYYGCVKGEGDSESQCSGLHSALRVYSELDAGNHMFCEFGKHYVWPANLLFGAYRKVQVSLSELREATKEAVGEEISQVGKDLMSLLVAVDKVLQVTQEIR